MQHKPLIVVTGSKKRFPLGWWATRFCLTLSGVRCHHVTEFSELPAEHVHGIVIGGGDDIDPKHYGDDGDAKGDYDGHRDALEMEVVRQGLISQIPIMGICRGAQLINVVLGGSLYSDIRPLRKRTRNRSTLFANKQAHLSRSSQLFIELKNTPLMVNQLHHQAIKRVAEPLKVSSKDNDQFIQSVERHEPSFILGVQWHPEYLPYLKQQRKIFAYFAQHVKNSNNYWQPEP